LQIKTSLTDERYAGVRLDVQFQGTLRGEQQQAADGLLQHETGVLAASTAFGKTVVAAYLIAQRQVNTYFPPPIKWGLAVSRRGCPEFAFE